MSNELQNKLDAILADKKSNITPGNLKAGKTCLGVNGTFDFVNEEEYPTYKKLSNKILGKDNIPDIPDEYELLDYIESTGEQYIVLNALENGFPYSIDATVQFVDIEDTEHFEGIYKGTTTGAVKKSLCFGYRYNENIDTMAYAYAICHYNKNIETTNVPVDTNVHRLSAFCKDTAASQIMGEGYVAGFYLDNILLGTNILTSLFGIGRYHGKYHIFGFDDSGTVFTNKLRVYNYKVCFGSNGSMDYNLYPVKRKSDGTIGLFNAGHGDSSLYGKFYTNQGTGEFLYKEL